MNYVNTCIEYEFKNYKLERSSNKSLMKNINRYILVSIEL